MHKHARTRGVWGHASPEKFLKLGALRSLLRPYLYSNLYLDSMPLEYRAKYFWSVARHVQGSLSHHCMCSSDGVWSKGHRTRQFEGGAVKGKSIPRGGTCPWCPPPPPPGSAAYPGTHFSLPGLYQLAQARPHNVLHFLMYM